MTRAKKSEAIKKKSLKVMVELKPYDKDIKMGTILVKLRNSLGMSVLEMASMLEITPSQLYRWENDGFLPNGKVAYWLGINHHLINQLINSEE